MGLDIRWPIGFIFTIYGTILVVFGWTANPQIFERSPGMNIDVAWGGVMLLFGLFMGGLALRASRR
ncbi:MAG: hypothetical protein DMG24_13460 [Acidobacteria bacterium]|nr:MAG: hypothetical protein DMG24_13460 [Acidobacteriota bacterium]